MEFARIHLQTHRLNFSKAACVVRVPTEVVKTRSQTSAFGGTSAISSLISARKTFEAEGFSGFYRGFGITVMREVCFFFSDFWNNIPSFHNIFYLTWVPQIPFTSIQFPLYEIFKQQISRRLGRKPLAHEAAICGSVAGGIAAASTTPLDVMKTRIMLDMRVCDYFKKYHAEYLTFQAGAVHRSFSSYFWEIYRAGGIKALFSGAMPRTLWISAGGAVFLGVYEWAIDGLQKY